MACPSFYYNSVLISTSTDTRTHTSYSSIEVFNLSHFDLIVFLVVPSGGLMHDPHM